MYKYMLSMMFVFPSASGVAGLAGALASNPIDVVKVRLLNMDCQMLCSINVIQTVLLLYTFHTTVCSSKLIAHSSMVSKNGQKQLLYGMLFCWYCRQKQSMRLLS